MRVRPGSESQDCLNGLVQRKQNPDHVDNLPDVGYAFDIPCKDEIKSTSEGIGGSQRRRGRKLRVISESEIQQYITIWVIRVGTGAKNGFSTIQPVRVFRCASV
jgi:hypothetical protein